MIKHHVTRKQSQHSSGQNVFLPKISFFPHLILVLVCLVDVFLSFCVVWLCVGKISCVFSFPWSFCFPMVYFSFVLKYWTYFVVRRIMRREIKFKKQKQKKKISKSKTRSKFIAKLREFPLMVLWLRVSYKELCLLLQALSSWNRGNLV